MAPTHDVHLERGVPETVLPALDPVVEQVLDSALAEPEGRRLEAVASVATADPRCLQAWASLAELATEPVQRYAFARVGYHRGLDALRAHGWRGAGYVRWRHPSNRGFLRSLAALEEVAAAIGEHDEAQRCAQFLGQLDPEWPPPDLARRSTTS